MESSRYFIVACLIFLFLSLILLQMIRTEISSLPLSIPSEKVANAILEYRFNKRSYHLGEKGYVDVWIKNGESNISIVWFGIHFDWMEEVGKKAFYEVAFPNKSFYIGRDERRYLGRIDFLIESSLPGEHSFFFWIELWREDKGSWYEEIWRTPKSTITIKG